MRVLGVGGWREITCRNSRRLGLWLGLGLGLGLEVWIDLVQI